MHALAEPLFIKDENAKIGPGLAESWEIAADSLSIKMKLRKDTTFHDGTPITAHDVKFSTERHANKKYKMVYSVELRKKVKNVEVIDDHNLIFHFNEDYNAFWDRFFEYFLVVPKKYIEKVGDEEYAKNPMGAGPYKWVGFKQDVWVEMEAFENHYRHVPEIKTWRMIYVPENSTRLAMLKTGEADMITPGAVHLNEIRANKDFRLVYAKNTRIVNLAFGDLVRPGKWPLQDRKVRMAVSHAIDRKTITEVILQGVAKPADSFLAPWHAGWDAIKAKPASYDPEKSKALLKEAGYPNGFDTQITITQASKRWMEAVISYLAQVGIKAKINILEQGAYTDYCFSKKTEGMIVRDAWWNSRAHPTTPIDAQLTLKAPWSCGITTKRVSDIMEEVGTLGISHPDLAKKAREMDDVIFEDMPRVNLWSLSTVIALGPRIESYQPINGFVIPTRMEFIKLKK